MGVPPNHLLKHRIFHEININKPSSELLGYPPYEYHPTRITAAMQPSPGRSSRHWDVHPGDSVATSPCPDSPTHRDAPATSGVEEKLRKTSGPGRRLGEEMALEVILEDSFGGKWYEGEEWHGKSWENHGKMMENAAGQLSQHVFKSQCSNAQVHIQRVPHQSAAR